MPKKRKQPRKPVHAEMVKRPYTVPVILDEVQGMFVPRHNGYKCIECGKVYLTVDLDEGVTPMFMTCFRTEGCMGQAVSLGYPKGSPPPDLPVLVEWFKPTQAEIEKRGIKHPGLIDHFNRGGLMRRAAPDAPEWVRSLM